MGTACWRFGDCERPSTRVFHSPARKSHPVQVEDYAFVCNHHTTRFRSSIDGDPRGWKEIVDPELKALLFVMFG